MFSLCMCRYTPGTLATSNYTETRLFIGYSKIALDVSVCVGMIVCLCVAL